MARHYQNEVKSFPTSTRIKIQTAGIPMTEERKFAILFAATLLSARKLIVCIESGKPNFAKGVFCGQGHQRGSVCAGEDR
jgi:hypothetical protein